MTAALWAAERNNGWNVIWGVLPGKYWIYCKHDCLYPVSTNARHCQSFDGSRQGGRASHRSFRLSFRLNGLPNVPDTTRKKLKRNRAILMPNAPPSRLPVTRMPAGNKVASKRQQLLLVPQPLKHRYTSCEMLDVPNDR